MSIIIFFGFAGFILLLGLTVISVTFYHWYKQAQLSRLEKAAAATPINK